MTLIFNKITETKTRKTLRNAMPKAEVLLWMKLKGKQLNGYKFRRQYSMGAYIVDFYCPELHLSIELDGDSHFLNNASVQYDQARQQWIESLGISVLRFTNTDVYQNMDAMVLKIMEVIKSKPPRTPPS